MFSDLKRGHYGAILADPPWRFNVWSGETAVQKRGSKTTFKPARAHYETMDLSSICSLPVADLASKDCALFLWVTWPNLPDGMRVIESWGFKYKTAAFHWMKVAASGHPIMGMGYWTRSCSEVCLLATRGKPKRLSAAVRQGILEPRREHSRKPDRIPADIERLVAGPYLELFARTTRPGWDVWGNQTDRFAA